MQKFNKVSTNSNFIKNLLATTYLPLVRSIREGDYICKGRLYIFRCEVIRCLSSGYIGSKKYLSNRPIADWETIQEFHFGDKDGKLSTNYVSNSEGYDYKTHERLGQYLRNLRDMYGLNLLPLYNCFSNQFLENHIIRNKKVIKTSEDNNTKIYKIPIKFNQDYTICIENLGLTTIAPAFIRYNSLLKKNNTAYGNGVDVTNQYISLHYADNVKSYVNSSFRKPFKVRFNNIPETKTVTFYNFNQYTSFTSDLAIEHNPSSPQYFKPGVVYYELTGDNPAKLSSYTETSDSSPYMPFTGESFEAGIHYFESDGYLFKLTSDQSKQPDKIYYTINKDYYTVVKTLAPNTKATYEITDEICSSFAEVEDHFYMLIQVPKVFNQNIVVLEGDYTSLEGQKYVDTLLYNELPNFVYDRLYTHDLNLMTSTSTEPRPFSPILIEYLLWNAISSLDTINNDFDRLSIELSQRYVPNTADLQNNFPNYWYNRYRQIISDFVFYRSKNVYQDNIGYVSKDIEKLIYKDTNL